MKKFIVSLLIGFFCLTSGVGLAATTALASPHWLHHHHHSFWAHTGKWIAAAGVLWWLIDESNHHKKAEVPAAAPQPEMLPGDRALHNVYGDNIPQVK